MNATIKNIVKSTFNSFADSKWNDTIVFSSDDVLGQLDGYTEI